MFGKREKKNSGSMEPVERTGNIWGKKILGMWNGQKLGISRVTEKKHSGNAELVEETGNVWENRRKHSGNVEPVEGETGDVWEKKKENSGNAELVETEDIQDNREKAFWKCRAGGGNWGCLRMLFLWFFRHPQFPLYFLCRLRISRMLFLCYPGYPQLPPVLHSQNIFFSFPRHPQFPPTGFTFPECFLLFSQTSPVSSASSAFPECFFSVSLDIPSFHQFCIPRIFFPLFPRHPQFPPLAPHFQNAFSLFSELRVEEPSDRNVRESVDNMSQGHTGMQSSGKQ